MTIRTALVLCALSAAVGCAAPQYDKPIGTFATATSDVQTALAGYGKTVVDTQEETTRNIAVAAPYRVRSLAGECGPNSTRCRLVVYQQQGDPSPLYQEQGDPGSSPPSPATPIPRLVNFMASVANYAGDLKAIAMAQTTGAVEASANAARGSVAKIAALVPGAGTEAAPAYARPTFSTLGWARLRALQYAVAQADPVLGKAGEEYSAVMQEATNAIRSQMAEIVKTRRAAFRARSTRENLDKVAAAAEAYDAFLMKDATPDAVFRELVKAHANLNKALQSPGVSAETLTEQMNAFQAQANQLAKILGGLQRV